MSFFEQDNQLKCTTMQGLLFARPCALGKPPHLSSGHFFLGVESRRRGRKLNAESSDWGGKPSLSTVVHVGVRVPLEGLQQRPMLCLLHSMIVVPSSMRSKVGERRKRGRQPQKLEYSHVGRVSSAGESSGSNAQRKGIEGM